VKTIRCGTVQRAKDYAKAAIARRRSHRYEPLAGNIAIRRRLANRGAEFERALATILFVDIVRSTEKAARLGDSRWTRVMNHYYAAVRGELKTLRGKEVVTTGDGLLATFGAPAAGIRCATAIREAARPPSCTSASMRTASSRSCCSEEGHVPCKQEVLVAAIPEQARAKWGNRSGCGAGIREDRRTADD
jgi:hypothetical protein